MTARFDVVQRPELATMRRGVQAAYAKLRALEGGSLVRWSESSETTAQWREEVSGLRAEWRRLSTAYEAAVKKAVTELDAECVCQCEGCALIGKLLVKAQREALGK